MSKVTTKAIRNFKGKFVLIVSEFELIGNSPYVMEIVSNKKPKF
jgi:hypothetical protein